jgi:hypothetical protein
MSTSKSTSRTETPAEKSMSAVPAVLTTEEAATRLKLSTSWLAKARMRGDGPPYIRMGRNVRYIEVVLIQWMKSRQRLSTSEP